jgi:hypothetical protein
MLGYMGAYRGNIKVRPKNSRGFAGHAPGPSGAFELALLQGRIEDGTVSLEEPVDRAVVPDLRPFEPRSWKLVRGQAEPISIGASSRPPHSVQEPS